METQLNEDSMLIEGGPVQPKPTITYWSLPPTVSSVGVDYLQYSVYCTVYSVQCTVCTVHCTQCTVQCTLYINIQCN